jgi:hypothetical protein
VTLPVTWTRSESEIFCLTCSRAQAGDMAVESAPADCPRADLVRLRRTALIEFEIDRCPEAPNGAIAQACRTSTGTVAAVREASLEPAAAHAETRRSGDG